MADKTQVIAPVPRPKTPAKKDKKPDAQAPRDGETLAQGTGESMQATPAVDPYRRKPGDSLAVGDWRERMGDEAIKVLYKERAAVAECVNAQARNRNLVRLPVRGLKKVKAVAYLYALAHNLMRMISLAPELLGVGADLSRIHPMPA